MGIKLLLLIIAVSVSNYSLSNQSYTGGSWAHLRYMEETEDTHAQALATEAEVDYHSTHSHSHEEDPSKRKKVYEGDIAIAVDGALNDVTVKVNGLYEDSIEGTTYKFPFYQGWNKVMILAMIDKLGKTDELKGVLGSVRVNEEIFNTNKMNWRCNGHTPVSMGWNRLSVSTNYIQTIDSNAQWIWGETREAKDMYSSDSSLNFYDLICESDIYISEELSTIYLTAEETLLEVTVNGRSIKKKLTGELDDSTSIKKVTLPLRDGDLIQIKALNYKEVKANEVIDYKGIMATIDLGDRIINTTPAVWKCNGKDSVYVPSSAPTCTLGFMDKIHKSAYWIWSSDDSNVAVCEVTIPFSHYNAFMHYSSNHDLFDVLVDEKSVINQSKKEPHGRSLRIRLMEGKNKVEIRARKEEDNNSVPGIIAFVELGDKTKFATNTQTWKCNHKKAAVLNGAPSQKEGFPIGSQYIWNEKNLNSVYCETIIEYKKKVVN